MKRLLGILFCRLTGRHRWRWTIGKNQFRHWRWAVCERCRRRKLEDGGHPYAKG